MRDAIANLLALNAYIAVAGYSRYINIALLANPFMTSLALLSMGHLFDTVTGLINECECQR